MRAQQLRPEPETQILTILEATSVEAHTEEIADRLGVVRHTAAKYLEVLKAKGRVSCRRVGNAKLWKAVSKQAAIRTLQATDIPQLLSTERLIELQQNNTPGASRRLGYLEETLRFHFSQGDPSLGLGAEIDGRLVGYILAEIRAWEFGSGEKTGWIKILGVDPEFQSRGIGRQLGEALLARLHALGARRVRTLVDWYAGELISYFRALGFQIWNVIPLETSLGQRTEDRHG